MAEQRRYRLGLDAHVHARDGDIAEAVVPFTSAAFGAAIWMPNLHPQPILTGPQAVAYGQTLDAIAHNAGHKYFQSYPLIQLTEQTTPDQVKEAANLGIKGVKVYPRNVTTNSENGVLDYTKIVDALKAVRDNGMVASFHGEHPSYDVEGDDKEKAFFEILLDIVAKVPGLRVILEHISTEEAVRFVSNVNFDVYASITIHHLYYTADDEDGYSEASKGKGNSHLICKPKLKRKVDRRALISAAISGNPRFIYGGDSAPHLKKFKGPWEIACGDFNAPTALPSLVELFDTYRAPNRLEPFISVFGFAAWNIKPISGYVVVEQNYWPVPLEYHVAKQVSDSIIPMRYGETLPWQIVGYEP
jgi:dihydroorotase